MADDDALRRWFQSVDLDGSNSINVSELERALAAGNLRFPIQVVAQMIRMNDTDRNGMLNFEEFVRLYNFLTQVQNSFHARDPRRRGVLGLDQVRQALQDLHFALDDPSFFSACQSFDPLRTGTLRLKEFISLCVFLQSARKLFGAFDVGNQGHLTLDFNQFIFCASNLRQ